MLLVVEMKKKIKLISLEKYGFLIDNRYRKWHTQSKKMFARESVIKALLKARKSLPRNYNFKIFDAKRSLSSQKIIVKKFEKDLKKKYPKNWLKMLNKFTGGYSVLTNKNMPINTHRQGGALDITLIHDGKELDMGGRTYSEKDHLNFFEKKRKLSQNEKKVRNNRKLLKKVMKKTGFKSYLPEWWHWGYDN